jgi:hypothetical protein
VWTPGIPKTVVVPERSSSSIIASPQEVTAPVLPLSYCQRAMALG